MAAPYQFRLAQQLARVEASGASTPFDPADLVVTVVAAATGQVVETFVYGTANPLNFGAPIRLQTGLWAVDLTEAAYQPGLSYSARFAFHPYVGANDQPQVQRADFVWQPPPAGARDPSLCLVHGTLVYAAGMPAPGLTVLAEAYAGGASTEQIGRVVATSDAFGNWFLELPRGSAWRFTAGDASKIVRIPNLARAELRSLPTYQPTLTATDAFGNPLPESTVDENPADNTWSDGPTDPDPAPSTLVNSAGNTPNLFQGDERMTTILATLPTGAIYPIPGGSTVTLDCIKDGIAFPPIPVDHLTPGSNWAAGIARALVSPFDMTSTPGIWRLLLRVVTSTENITCDGKTLTIEAAPMTVEAVYTDGRRVLGATTSAQVAAAFPAGAAVSLSATKLVPYNVSLGLAGIALTPGIVGNYAAYVTSGYMGKFDWTDVVGSPALAFSATYYLAGSAWTTTPAGTAIARSNSTGSILTLL